MDRVFANAIRHFREKAKLTQAKVTEISGVSQSQMSKLEDGSHWPNKRTIRQLCKTFDISPKEFFIYMAKDILASSEDTWFDDEEDEGND